MARCRMLDSEIWRDERFRALDSAEKIRVIQSVVFDRADPEWERFAGPAYDEPEAPPELVKG